MIFYHNISPIIADLGPLSLRWYGLLFVTGLVITFFVYAFGVMNPLIPIEKLSYYWSISVHDYIGESGAPTGWNWVGKLGYGDYVNFLGIAFLAGLTVIAYLTLLPSYAREKDWAFFAIVVTECLVLIVAASGILGSGGH